MAEEKSAFINQFQITEADLKDDNGTPYAEFEYSSDKINTPKAEYNFITK